MARFIIRSIVSTIVTMLLVSITLFVLLEVGSGDITLKILGVFSTEEQRDSYRAQLGLDRAAWLRYVDWLIGNDWRVSDRLNYPLVVVENPQTGEQEWWAGCRWQPDPLEDGEGEMYMLVRQPMARANKVPADDVWQGNDEGNEVFLGRGHDQQRRHVGARRGRRRLRAHKDRF